MSDWVPIENERPREIGEFIRYEGNLCSNGSWTGFRLAQGEVQPGQLPEGYLLTHLVSLHLGKPAIVERYVVGNRRRTEMVTPESLFVFPAKVPFAGEWQSRLPRLDLLIEPEFVSNVVRPEVAANRLELRHTYSAGDPFIAQVLYALRQDNCGDFAADGVRQPGRLHDRVSANPRNHSLGLPPWPSLSRKLCSEVPVRAAGAGQIAIGPLMLRR